MSLKKIQLSDFLKNYKKSGREMELALFKPINFSYWLKLGFLSFLNQIPLFLFIFFFNFIVIPSRFLQWNKILPILPHIIITFPFLFILFLFFFSFFLYLSGFSNYFYLEFLTGRKCDLNSIEEYHKKLAKDYLILALFTYILIAFSFLLGFFIIFIFGEHFKKLYLFLFLFLFLLFFIFIQITVKDIYVPLSYFKKFNILESISEIINIISSNFLMFLLFLIIKTGFIIILFSGVLAMGFLSFGTLFLIFIIPVLGQTLLQPVIYFLNIFGINFFKDISKFEDNLVKNG